MATEPTEKKVRVRRKKAAASEETTPSTTTPSEKPKRAAKAIPVPMFQAPAVTKTSGSDSDERKPSPRGKRRD